MAHFRDTVLEVVLYLRQYKGRTFMTMFGLIWGTLTVVFLLSFGVGVEKSMKKNMHGLGDGIAIMWPGTTSKVFKGYNRGRSIQFRPEDAEYLRNEVREFNAISPEYINYDTPIRVGETVNKTAVTGIIPEYGPMRNVIACRGGRWLNDLDIEKRRRVAFIGYELRDLLFGEDADAVNKHIYIQETPFLVIGVLKEKTQPSSYGVRDQDRVFIPLTTHESIFGRQYINDIVYQVTDPTRNQEIQDKIYAALGKRFVFDPADKNALGIWDTTEQDKFIHYFSLGFKIFLGVLGTFTLIVGGIGLANIMYVVVKERTREIGIKRSIGARRKQIMSQFLIETFFIIGIGAAIGFVLALILIKLVSMLPIEDFVGHPQLSWPVLITSVTILALIGFLAGYFPARKASRLDVVECLRY